MQPIEIFRTGRHTDMAGATTGFSDADLAAAAAAYNPALHEAPIVIGHPAHDAPAYGWVAKLENRDGSLTATPAQVDTQFAEMVATGRFKKISASFYKPSSSANPAPGAYYLRHVGFLGAQPPAVKGLKSVEFAEDADAVVTVEFGDFTDRGIVRLIRRIRDFIVEQAGPDRAEQVLPAHELDFLHEEATREADQSTAAFAAPAREKPKQDKPEEIQMADTPTDDDIQKREADLATREAELSKQAASFAEREIKARRADNERLLADLEKAGKFAPGMRAAVLDFMDRLDAAETVEFGENKDRATETALDFFRGLLKGSGTIIDFSERAKEDGLTVAPKTAEALAAAALQYQEAQRAGGREIHIADAVIHVSKTA